MATVRDVITAALRKPGVLGAGDTAAAEDAADALPVLQSMYLEWVASGAFGRLTDVLKEADYTAKEQERVRKDAACTVSLPDTITDAGTGEARAPRDLSLVVVTYPAAGTVEHHLYDAFLGDWVRLDGLDLDATAPLSGRGLDGLVSCLARRVAEDHGRSVGPVTMRSAALFESALSSRFSSERRETEVDYF